MILCITYFHYLRVRNKAYEKMLEPSESGTFCGDHAFEINETEILSEGKGYSGKHDWQIVKHIEKTDEMVIIFLDSAYGFIFPLSQLEGPEAFYQFITNCFDHSRTEAD